MGFNCIILGAAGRDFHDFQTFFRAHPELRVCCFTAQQIPFIDARSFPRELAGPDYDADVPIFPEAQLPELIRRYAVDFVFLAYSDLSHEEVMHRASIAQAAGASFALLGPRHTELSVKPKVIAVTAVRTGAGKSPLSQHLAAHLHAHGTRVGVIRHPMPYGDLLAQRVQRFASFEDLERHRCTIEEREEYAPYIERGLSVYAGVDYAAIAELASADHDVLLWDGGNNDFSFLRPTLRITVLDALRPGHELRYHRGETNLRMADVLVINKVDQAAPADVAAMRERAHAVNPRAELLESTLAIEVDETAVHGRRALVVEDGPTLTHGGMAYGAGVIAARRAGVREAIDPRPYAAGSLAQTFREHPHIGPALPAMGYSAGQLEDLHATILSAAPEVVIDASPAGLARAIAALPMPVVRVRYRFVQRAGTPIEALVAAALRR